MEGTRHPCLFGAIARGPVVSRVWIVLLALLGVVISGAGQTQVDSRGNVTGFRYKEGNSAVGNTNISCVQTGTQLSNNILSLASEIQGISQPVVNISGACFFNGSRLRLTDYFSTQFAFTLAPHTGNVTDERLDGMAFVIFEEGWTVGDGEGYLGVLDNQLTMANKVVAIEFDSFTNPELDDPPYHHVGLDVGSMNSTVTAEAGFYETATCSKNITLTTTNLTGEGRIQAWIDYNGTTNQLNVTISPILGFRPPKPLLTMKVDLGEIFPNRSGLYVGFTASTGANFPGFGWAYVLDWSFNVSGRAVALYPPKSLQNPCPKDDDVDVGLVVGVTVPSASGIILVGVLLVGCYFLRVRRSIYRQFKLVELENLDYRPRQYKYKEISKATEDFSKARELGRGGFGVVYKGTLSSTDGVSTEVAVKRIMPGNKSPNVLQDYVSEMRVIGRLRHRNLVQLLGWCHEKKGEFMQVYEYLPNGSLDRLIFNRGPDDGLTTLSWDQRFHIITGVAAALVYLHEEWKQLVVHRDVKVSNVILDSKFHARLGDFGLARLYEHSRTPDLTKMAGTFGYMAPELINGEFTEKSDVFSFGIVALEVVTGRHSIELWRPNGEEQLAFWVRKLYDDGKILNAADSKLEGRFSRVQMSRVVHVGILCSLADPVLRPTMRQALQMLNGEAGLTPFPSSLSHSNSFQFDVVRDSSTDTSSGTSSSLFSHSINEIKSEDDNAHLVLGYDQEHFQNSTAVTAVNPLSLIR